MLSTHRLAAQFLRHLVNAIPPAERVIEPAPCPAVEGAVMLYVDVEGADDEYEQEARLQSAAESLAPQAAGWDIWYELPLPAMGLCERVTAHGENMSVRMLSNYIADRGCVVHSFAISGRSTAVRH